MDKRRNLVNYSHKFGEHILEDQSITVDSSVAVKKQTYRLFQSIRKSKTNPTNPNTKQNRKYNDILKISGRVPSTGMLCLMTPENGLESQGGV